MKEDRKIRVAVLYGGKSGEHEVSLVSAASVIKHLDRERFEITPIAIDKSGHWYLNKLPDVYLPADSKLLLGEQSGTFLPLPVGNSAIAQVKDVVQATGLPIDVVFPVMHGPLCEDGTMQGLLEIADVPYVGSGVLASAIAMDKDIAKRLILAAGIPSPKYLVLHSGADEAARDAFCQQIIQDLGLPAFVKPARLGSSVGIQKAKTIEELQRSIHVAFELDEKVIVEQALDVIDIELSLLENETYGQLPLVSIPGQIGIAQHHEFYSYEAKYLDPQGAELIIPAQLTPQQVVDAQQMAIKIFQTIECEGMARVDLFLERTTGQFYFNEINTIPGFTSISMYPRMWQASGIGYTQLLSRLIDLAMMRHRRKRQLTRDYQLHS